MRHLGKLGFFKRCLRQVGALVPFKIKSDLFAGSVLIGAAGVSGWLIGSAGNFAENYFSAEQAQKRMELREQEAAKALVREQEKAAEIALQKAAEEAEIAAQRKAGEGRMTPEIKELLFARVNLANVACYPNGYGFEARVDAKDRIIYFKETLIFRGSDFGSSLKKVNIVDQCLRNINLAPYWESAKLPAIPSSSHMDVMKDIYVLCGTGVKEEESVASKDGIMTYQFSIAAEQANVSEPDAYKAYWGCVNSSFESPVFNNG